MTSVSGKEVNASAYPKTLLSIVASVGGLAVFLIIASTILVHQPIGSTVRGYFYAIDSSRNIHSDVSDSSVSESHYSAKKLEDTGLSNSAVWRSHSNEVGSSHGNGMHVSSHDTATEIGKNHTSEAPYKTDLSDSWPEESKNSENKLPYSGVRENEDVITRPSLSDITSPKTESISKDVLQTDSKNSMGTSASITNSNKENPVDLGCDLSQGQWIYDPAGPLYTNNSCPVITQMQNCQGNGRPDKEYENWRWKPSHCELPRFDAKMFLELMRGKTLAFIGDSVARNQMESMLCILWQVDTPKNRGNRKMQRYYFSSTSTMIVRIWSSWLVHQTPEPFDFAPAGVVKLHLDLADETFMEYISGFDVVVLSSGHWFAKQSVYILNNEIVGGQLWWPDNTKQKKIDNIEAFGISVETIVTALNTHPNYTGLTLVRSFSPDHYEGGAWNTGGSCTGKERPALKGELVENGFTNIMHEKQVAGFQKAMKKKTNKSKMNLMDITEAFSYRHDGHPGPYRSLDPNKITKRGPDGRPPPQDCLHWCMPGPVDTWNELVFENIKREYRNGWDGLS